ncbi:MAG: hypothetical protein LBE09_05650 [Christensenellaceae bacterium]|nr:hypothetical protein [Christensenellaceae bacterium]
MDKDDLARGDTFSQGQTNTVELESDTSDVKYDLVGKVSYGTTLTRKTMVQILTGIERTTFAWFKTHHGEFIKKAIDLINEQKAAHTVDHIICNQIDGTYDSDIFTAEKQRAEFEKAFKGTKAIQDYAFTGGTAEKSIERKFVEDLDSVEEVCVYAKLPRGFEIPTPMGNYAPDWAIAFNEGTVKQIYFVVETKGTLESLEQRSIESAKIKCARKLFNEFSRNHVKYHDVTSYQQLLAQCQKLSR